MSGKTLEDHLRDAYFEREAARATSVTGATFERRAGDHEAAIAAEKREPSDRAMWDFVKSKPPPSARGSVTVRRPDGTTITCTIDQLQDVLEQVHKVRPRPIEITCTAVAKAGSNQ